MSGQLSTVQTTQRKTNLSKRTRRHNHVFPPCNLHKGDAVAWSVMYCGMSFSIEEDLYTVFRCYFLDYSFKILSHEFFSMK